MKLKNVKPGMEMYDDVSEKARWRTITSVAKLPIGIIVVSLGRSATFFGVPEDEVNVRRKRLKK